MRLSKVVLFFTLFTCCRVSVAQVVDNLSSFKNMGNSYIRFHYDNDYFTKTDEFYTQGISLEYANPSIKKFPITKILYRPKESDIKYGISIDHYAYTPTSIRSDDILYGDRPFCANLSLKIFSIATNSVKQQRIATTFITGLMGPGAGGREMQTSIHRWLKNVQPHGWQYQIKNDLILDYQINYEKKLWGYKNAFLLNATGEGRIGTHNDNLKAGFNFMVCNFNNPYKPAGTDKKFWYYLYGQFRGGLVGYDATLQGGLFNRQSPYTISAGDITRVTLQGDYGIVVSFGKMYLEYCQSILTTEFSTGTYHRWGGVRIGVAL